jgi:hypothetical protein
MTPETTQQLIYRTANRLFGQPIIQNQFRSTFVEAMIEPYLADAGWRYVGSDWNGWDFERNGQRLEVKQSARVQSWSFARRKLTRPTFDIAPRTGYFHENGASWVSLPGRIADVYVFAWHGVEPYGPLADGNPYPVDQRDASQWVFYVVPASALPADAKTISLRTIERRLPVQAVPIEKLSIEIEGSLKRVREVQATASWAILDPS